MSKMIQSILIVFLLFSLEACVIGNSVKFPTLGPDKEAELLEHEIGRAHV